jgi:predicted phosphodiesterase
VFFAILLFASNLIANEKTTIAIWGDSKDNFLGATTNVADHLLYKTTDWDFQIHTGDFVTDGRESDWEKSLNYKGMDSLFVKDKIFMCVGNHDANRTTWDKYTADVLPVNSVDSTTHFYHYQKGNVHVVVCDGYLTSNNVMNDWLDQELATIPNEDWLIGLWHNPCYGDISNKDDYRHVCLPWLEKFYAAGGDFIMHGHSHSYIRSHPVLPDGTVDNQNGMVHIINGCGGANFKSTQDVVEKTAYTPSQRAFACVTFLTLEDNIATIETVDVRTLINYGTIDYWVWDRTSTSSKTETAKIEKNNLAPCYPNPFNPSTIISYTLSKPGFVKLAIYDVLGREIKTLINENQNSGTYTLEWRALDSLGRILPSGLYFYKIETESFVQTRKMMLLE